MTPERFGIPESSRPGVTVARFLGCPFVICFNATDQQASIDGAALNTAASMSLIWMNREVAFELLGWRGEPDSHRPPAIGVPLKRYASLA